MAAPNPPAQPDQPRRLLVNLMNRGATAAERQQIEQRYQEHFAREQKKWVRKRTQYFLDLSRSADLARDRRYVDHARQLVGHDVNAESWIHTELPTVKYSDNDTPAEEYILSDISKFVRDEVSKYGMEFLDGLSDDSRTFRKWLYDDKVSGYGDEVVGHIPASELHLGVKALLRIIDTPNQTTIPNGTVRELEGLLLLLERLPVLRRYADARNTELPVAPLPDGSNLIHHPFEQISWIWYRTWIRALHYRSARIGTDGELLGHFLVALPMLSLGLLVIENEKIPQFPIHHHQNRDEYKIFTNAYRNLGNLMSVLDDIIVEERRAPIVPPYTLAETITYNAAGLGQRLTDLLDVLPEGEGSMTKLLRILEVKREAMARATDEDHIEDVQFEKRFVVNDDKYEMMDYLKDLDYNPAKKNFENTLPFEKDEDMVASRRQVLAKTGQVNQLRHGYLLLKDWNRKKPWKQLYMIIDVSAAQGDPSLASPIHEFNDHLSTLKRVHPMHHPPGRSFRNKDWPQLDIHYPSNRANIFANLSPIFPIASNNLPSEQEIPHLATDPCAICCDALSTPDQRVLAQLFCGHILHYRCIREYWDRPRFRKFHCPHCRLSQYDWELHKVADIVPEVLDTWDYEEVAGSNAPVDEQSKVWLPQQTAHRAAARMWNYDATTANTFREPHMEMAVWRLARDKHNQALNTQMRLDQVGIFGFDEPP